MPTTPPPFSSLIHQAIKAALANSWEEAIEYNLKIISHDSHNIDALNRLTQAYTELGKVNLAKATANKVLQLDHYNPIAKKNLHRLTAPARQSLALQALAGGPPGSIPLPSTINPQLFLEEPGKTKSVSLTKVTESPLLRRLTPGQVVALTPKARTITVSTPTGGYLGSLPDDLSHRLIKLIRLGNHYTALVRSIGPRDLAVMIQETSRSKRVLVPSFPPPPHSPTLNP